MVDLFINTALKITHVALFRDEKLIDQEMWEGQFHEFDTLMPTVEKLFLKNHLKMADLGRIVVCHGPGGFTSVRLGVSAANALAFALHIPVAKISVFKLLSFCSQNEKDFFVVIKANPSEVYVQGFGKCAPVFPTPVLIDKEKFEARAQNDCLLIADYEKNSFDLPWGDLDFQEEVIEPWYYKEARIT